jgi:hypothetical protein
MARYYLSTGQPLPDWITCPIPDELADEIVANLESGWMVEVIIAQLKK